MLNLFSIAANNANDVYTVFNTAIKNLSDQESINVTEFAAWVESETLISINLRLCVIAELLCGNPYKNIHEWAQQQAMLSGRAKDEILRERLKGYYEKRLAFDCAFEDGEQFRYGALNAKSMGLFAYGAYCVVLTSNFQISLTQSAYLSDDSLEKCFAKSNTFDHNALVQNAAPYSYRHWLAANKRMTEISQAPKDAWPELLISSDCKQYVEVIFTGEIKSDALQCIRMSQKEYELMWALAFANFGISQSEAERAWVQDFNQLLMAQRDGKIQLEIMP